MLTKKLIRTAWKYKAQFLSMILMVAIGVGVFLGFNIEWKSIEADTSAFFEETKYADFRLYSEKGFSKKGATGGTGDSGRRGGDAVSVGQHGYQRNEKGAESEYIGGLYGLHDAGDRGRAV